MTDFRERYKRLGFDQEANRALRSQRRDEARRGHRDEQMSLRRDMGAAQHADDSYEDTTTSTQESAFSAFSQDCASYKTADTHGDSKDKAAAEHEAAVQQRWERLQKWREEKNKRKQLEKKKAKPVFKVGVVHHRVYSPPVNKEPAPLPPPKLCKSLSANLSQTAPPKRVTRATEKRLAVKTIKDQQKRENMRSKKKAQPKAEHAKNEDKQMEIVPKDHEFKAPVGITPMPIFGRQALEATKANIQVEISSFHIPATSSVGAFSDSFNESALSLKLSSDEQEMLDESATHEVSSPVSRHSTKNQSPPTANEASVKGVTPIDQEMMEVEQFSKTEKRNGSFSKHGQTQLPLNTKKSEKAPASSVRDNETLSRKKKPAAEEPKEIAVDSPRRTRSTRATERRRSVRIVSTDSADSGIEPNLTPDEPAVNKRRSTKVTSAASANIDSETESNSTPDNKGQPSTNRRKSTAKVVPSGSTENESVPTPPKKSMNKRRSTKLVTSGSIDNEENGFVKPASNRRRSTKLIREAQTLDISNAVTIADVHMSPLANQEPSVPVESPPKRKSTRFTTNGQGNLDFNNTNLMDFTFSAPAKPPKLVDVPKSLLDDSMMNLSPRRSSRLPPKAPTDNREEDQPLIRFSSFYVPPPAANESSSSEPTKQHSPNDIMNLSLNMSLPKESEEEKPPAFFSPYIVQSRGKNSERKEMKKRRFSRPGVESQDIPTKDNIMEKLHISVEEEQRTAQYYKLILNNEIERLNEFCDRWNAIKEDPETPEEARYIIQAACGQTQLLINKKFERFRRLVQDCETGRGEMLVTCKDLQGFWEMMYMEINDCESRFNKLKEMQDNNWTAKEDELAVKEVEKKKKKAPVKKPAAKKPAAGKPSSLRAMIAAARKKRVEGDSTVEGVLSATTEPIEKPTEEANNAGKPTTPPKTNSRHISTPKSVSKWDNLLKKVQLSQTKKATTSPLVVMKLSQMVKTPEVQLDDSIVYINSGRTPAKSILKKDEVMGSVSKSTNKVFFREQSNEVKEFEIRNSFVDMSLDNIEETKEPIERKLNFEDESFVEISVDKDQPSESMSHNSRSILNSSDSPKTKKVVSLAMSPTISMSPLSLEDKKSENLATKTTSTKLKKQISFQPDTEESQPRNLRTKKFSAPLTPIPKRRVQEDTEEDISMESSDAAREGDNDTPQQKSVKEIYLNEQGVICERFVPIQKSTPGTSNLKRSNSETTHRNKKSIQILEPHELKTTSTPQRLRRRNANVPAIQVNTPKGSLTTPSIEGKSSTSRSKGQSLKRSFADTTLTPDNAVVSTEETTTPKLSKRTPTTSKSKSELKENSTKSSRLKRTSSLKVKNHEKDSVAQAGSVNVRRTMSLNIRKIDTEGAPKVSLKRKSLKKLQENIEPNEQETDESTKERLPKTPSFKRTSSKKLEKLTGVSDTVSDAMTPNIRRKSLRITRASVRDEN